ncbi:MAG: L-threonine 3-dehydrogenase [Anaerolineae bacterium]
MPEKMQAVLKVERAAGAEIREVDVPAIGPRDILVKVKATSICGTDVHIYDWDPWAQSRIVPPLIFGHEFCGEVVEVGAEVGEPAPGAFISAESHIVDNNCYQCRTGQKHVCRNMVIIGVDRPGSFAEYIAIPAENAWVNPSDLPPEIATLEEPFGNAVHTALAHSLASKTVLVTGCGPIGLMAIAVARASGATAVYATEVNPYRLALAEKMGATLAFNPREVDAVEEIMKVTRGEGVDVLLEMSGHPAAIEQGFTLLKNGGRVAMLGLPSKPLEFDFANHVIFKGATVYGVTGRRIHETWYQMTKLLTGGAVDLAPLVTHRFPLDQFEQAMAVIHCGQSGKVVLFPP